MLPVIVRIYQSFSVFFAKYTDLPSLYLQPNWRNIGKFSSKCLGNIITMIVPLYQKTITNVVNFGVFAIVMIRNKMFNIVAIRHVTLCTIVHIARYYAAF